GARGIAGTFTPDEADQILYDGTEVDLAPAVREQILLTLPMSALCKDDCRGLCQVCGQDLNERECGCDRRVTDPRWAALRSVKLPRKEPVARASRRHIELDPASCSPALDAFSGLPHKASTG